MVGIVVGFGVGGLGSGGAGEEVRLGRGGDLEVNVRRFRALLLPPIDLILDGIGVLFFLLPAALAPASASTPPTSTPAAFLIAAALTLFVSVAPLVAAAILIVVALSSSLPGFGFLI